MFVRPSECSAERSRSSWTWPRQTFRTFRTFECPSAWFCGSAFTSSHSRLPGTVVSLEIPGIVVSLEIPRLPPSHSRFHGFWPFFCKKTIFQPQKKPRKSQGNLEKIPEKYMYIVGEVRKVSHVKSRVRRRFWESRVRPSRNPLSGLLGPCQAPVKPLLST